ncbi:MAG: YggS family pyridoxal phosphate-dependent enzyme [Gemmatimonadetes bacterium]|nr:YggS family pyridoxal phosphate-dependent enzyme [Gemmatimonadota bacterium]
MPRFGSLLATVVRGRYRACGGENVSIQRDLESVEDRIRAACMRSGRRRREVRLVAVTKTVEAERINEAIRAGVRFIGENRVQEARDKFPLLIPVEGRHLIGQLQRNKAGKAVELFDLVESVDRISLAEALSRRAAQLERELPVLIEVNTSGEESKAGIAPGGAPELVEAAAALPNLSVRGLMTIGPLTQDQEKIRAAFRTLRELRDSLAQKEIPGADLEHLSMGMSGDFEIGIEEGATIVRVGSAIFGRRA